MSAATVIKARPQRQKGNIPTLVELCTRVLAENIEEASLEALEHLPIALLWRVYKYYATGWSVQSPSLTYDRKHSA